MTIKKGRAVGLLGFVLALLAGLSGAPQALAQTFPSQIPTKAEALEAAVKLIPGLDKAGISNFKASNNAASGDIKLKGRTVTVVAFKRPGISKVLIAIAPANFKLTDFLPIPRGTPIDGVAFRNMAFVYVPKGAAKKDVSTSGLPQKVASALNKSGNKVDLNEGLNLFGEADFASSGGVKKVLQAIGLNNFTLPLNGTLPTNLFKVNPKNVRGKLKDQLLDALRLNLKLKKLRIPGMPNSVVIKDAGLAILSKKLKNKRRFIAGVNGKMVAKANGKNIDFNFYILADKAGSDSKLVLKGDTKSKLTLNLVEKMTLSNLGFEATKAGNKWSWQISGDTTFRSKKVSAVYQSSRTLTLSVQMSLAEITGHSGLPVLKDIKSNWVVIKPRTVVVDMNIKGVRVDMDLWKPQESSKYYAGFALGDFSPTKLIPGTENSPLKDATFKGLVFIHKPTNGTETVARKDLPDEVGYNIQKFKGPVVLKKGLNMFGKMDIKPSGEMAKLLKAVGIRDVSLPLSGAMSPLVLSKNPGAVKNAILDNLDLKIPLPKISMPGLSKVANIRSTTLAIKGLNKDGKRGIDVKIAGELDVKVGNEEVVFDFDVKVKPRSGKKPEIVIAATEAPGKTIKIKMLEEFTLRKLSFNMNNAQDRWVWEISGDTKFRSKTVNVGYVHDPKAGKFMYINTKMTLADIAGGSLGLPGLDDVMLENIQVWNNKFVLETKVKGKSISLVSFKRPGISKPYVSVQIGNAAATDFIPDSGNTPLKDVKFENLSFLYSPAKQAGKASDRGIVPNVRGWLDNAGKDVVIKPGLNIYGKLIAQPSGEMGRLLKQVGVTELGLPLNGGFSPKAFSKNISGAAVKNAILDELDLNIKLPPLKIPEIDEFLAFSNGSLKIKGKTPDGKRGIDVAISGDADVKVKNDSVAFNVDVQYDKSELSFKGSTDKKWTHPLGIDFLDLDSLTLNIDKKKGKYDIDIAAKTDIGSYSRLDVAVNVDEKNGKIIDAFFNLKGPLKLSEIPGVKDIPNAGKFEINTIKVSEHGIEAKTDFGGNKNLDVYLFNGSGWNMIVRQDNLTITEFVPPLKDTPLKHIVLSEAAIVLSKDGLQGPLSGFSPIAQDALKDVYGASAANINVGSGLSLIAAFESRKSRGGMAGAFKRLGLTQERVIMTGDIGGLFGGPTELSVKVALDGQTSAKNQPKWMKSKPGVKAVFSMIAIETAGQFDIEFGIGADITAKVHGTELLFDAKTALEIEDEKIDVKIAATLKDQNGWKKPFGIPGFTLKEVGMDLGLDEDGAIHLGFDGNIEVSGDKYAVAADADLLPEALGAPQDIAFKGSASKVDMFFIEEIAIDMMGSDFKLDIPGGILPTFTDVKFAFVTPGAQDPDLNITGEGFALAGGMSWLDHDVGKMDVSVGPTKGIYASGKIDNLDLGPLTMKNNDFTMDIGLKSLPTLKIDSDIELLGAKERFKVSFNNKGVSMAAVVKLGPDISMTTDLDLSGVDLSVKKPRFKKADFSMMGDLKLDIGKFIAGPARQSLVDITNDLNAGFKDAEKAVTSARNKVNGLTSRINAARAKVRREKAAAESRVRGAENRVNSLNGRLSGEWRSYHHCHGWGKWPCRAREGIRIGWTKGELRVADGILNFVRSLVSHFPIDLDPRVAALITARDTAKEALYVAEKSIEGADFMDKFIKEATDKLTNGLKDSINIKKASFSGDLKGVIEHDTPVDLTLDAEMFGADINDTFAFKLKDVAYDVGQLGMMGLYAIEHLVDNGLKDIPGPLKNRIRGALASKMDAKNAARNRELAKYSKEFKNYNKTADAIQARIAAYNTTYLESKLAEAKSPLDYDKTETFAGGMIEVGHTGLCLTNNGGAIKQYGCKDIAGRQWSTKPASGAPGVKANAGYVYITETAGGSCIAPEGSWTRVERKFSDPKLPNAGSFTFLEQVFQGDGKISVKKCANTKEYYWKVLKNGDGWMQMANLATSQCLHFEDSSAVPGQAEAKWKPCTGASNQVYRVADSVTPKYYDADIALRNDAQSACFADPNAKGEILMVSCTQAARYNYSIDIRGYIKFINRTTGSCLQPASYANGAKLIERKCSNLDYQWWNPAETPGGWRIQNGQTGKCTRTAGLGKVADMGDCSDFSENIIAPITDPNSGATLTWKSPSSNPQRRYVASYSGTQSFSICTMGGMVGESWLSGTLVGKSCGVVLDGKQFWNTGSRQQYISAVDGVEWVASGGGKITEYALPTGFRQGPKWGGAKGVATAYTCRTKFTGDQANTRGRLVTGIGWTVDGRTCQYVYYGERAATEFEILARLPDKAYMLQLGDLKPMAKPGARRPPGPLALSKAMLDTLPKHLVPEPVVKVVKKAVKTVKKATRSARRYFHHRW